MSRESPPLDPEHNPVHRFAWELRDVRLHAGNRPLAQLARQMRVSHSSLSHFLNGDRLPPWELAEAFFTACNSDPEGFRDLWVEIAAAIRPGQGEGPDPNFGSLLDSVQGSFPASQLAGYWVTCFTFDRRRKCHADITQITAKSGRYVLAKNDISTPRTEGHDDAPYYHVIEAKVVSRNLIGHWKNTSGSRYLGLIHLGVPDGEQVMDGYYTSLSSDVEVGFGSWKWIRLDPGSIDGVNLAAVRLRMPSEICRLLKGHEKKGISLQDVVEVY